MKPSTSFFVLGLFLAQLGAAVPARAQSTSAEPSTPEGKQAQQHVSLGVKLYSEGDFGPA